MSIRTMRLAGVGLLALAPALIGGVASADDWAEHKGPPADWGPVAAAICAGGPGAVPGYNLIVGNNAANVITGTPLPDVIFALGGADTVRGGPADDVICLGSGNDRGRGDRDEDAVVGELGDDLILGDSEGDYLDGSPGFDSCNGGGSLVDVATACEAISFVP